ncbi:FAD linked oxidase [Pseudooceanicola batsensis HTCC2597]|uniref:FAD linked oxidase n=1 Tax=Pseudooceanicola batsensis (strain ATCC BAA-863 / DSM 15984 / KCTC 12145 / HTCC2597) TaxID=252305 RepID=A3TY45_PSEBH|nr:FAD-binding oxidoreductase [Pseudooceanicola batsensis]EAQ03079.1 FAD linked oxidase [Pseudooceanicola batsensis HTCC2597]
MIDRLIAIVGEKNLLRGADAAPYAVDISAMRRAEPLAVVRPADTAEVAAVVKLANELRFPVIPVGGRTGLCGAGVGEAVILSFERMAAIREIRVDAQVAVVEAGAILQDIHDAAEARGLVFPLTFGAKGSARVGGFLGTNAGGSNVLRHGNTRDLVLGLEAVLPDGEIVDLMSGLHKNNSGYDLRHLLIGAEGTLGVITAATLKLRPRPGAYATAMIGMENLSDALPLLNEVQRETGGLVEAFEYMPDSYVADYLKLDPAHRRPFDRPHPVNILIEIGALAPRDCTPDGTGAVPIVADLEELLGRYLEEGRIADAVVARNEAQRRELWARREAAAEVASLRPNRITNDVAVPLDRVETFLTRADAVLREVDPGAGTTVVAHLGDGNVHYTVWPTSEDPACKDEIMERVEDIVLDLGGSFSAEHGIGTAKLSSMARRKDPAALAAMRAIKRALDPLNIMNPGKLLPPE